MQSRSSIRSALTASDSATNPMLLTTQLLTTALTVVGAFACASMMRQACADDLDRTGVPA